MRQPILINFLVYFYCKQSGNGSKELGRILLRSKHYFYFIVKMPRGKELSEFEIRKIWFYKGKGWSERKISKFLKRSMSSILRVLLKKMLYGKKTRNGRRKALYHCVITAKSVGSL